MTNALSNINDLKDKLSEQIKVSIFNMLPDDKIADLVEEEIKAFFEEPCAEYWAVTQQSGYGSDQRAKIMARVSPFRLIVWNQLSKHLERNLDELFGSPEFIARCQIGDESVKDDIQNQAMSRQERIALGMASVLFDRMVGDSLLNATRETKSALYFAVQNVMSENGHL
ncbi:hypothetical protein RFA54_001648 [Vibrio vulnificus]|nr:hypothetical protein [Vibrio vulnificus]